MSTLVSISSKKYSPEIYESIWERAYKGDPVKKIGRDLNIPSSTTYKLLRKAVKIHGVIPEVNNGIKKHLVMGVIQFYLNDELSYEKNYDGVRHRNQLIVEFQNKVFPLMGSKNKIHYVIIPKL